MQKAKKTAAMLDAYFEAQKLQAAREAGRQQAVDAAACAVCADAPRDCVLGCGHMFCAHCAAVCEACPCCRASITSRKAVYA